MITGIIAALTRGGAIIGAILLGVGLLKQLVLAVGLLVAIIKLAIIRHLCRCDSSDCAGDLLGPQEI